MLPPLLFLSLMLSLTAFAWLAYRGQRHVRKSALRKLAGQWQMRYLPEDRFDLARRLGDAFPEHGSTDLRVIDLIYASQEDRHRYVFTLEYTMSLDAGLKRRRRVVTVCEPREHAPGSVLSSPLTAPDDLPVVDQYEYLKTRGFSCV